MTIINNRPAVLVAVAVATIFFAVSACGQSNDSDESEADGRALVADNCGPCHAIGKDDASPHAQAPPFRDVLKNYPAENLSEALAEGIVSGHPDMPEFVFEPTQIDEIIVYLNTLAPNPAPHDSTAH